MQMTANMFASIVASLRGGFVRRANERRDNPRVGVSAKATCIWLEAGKPAGLCEVTVRDISRNGIGLCLPRPVKPKDLFIVRLPGIAREPLALLYAVRHIHSLGSAGTQVGASLEKILPNAAPKPKAGAPKLNAA